MGSAPITSAAPCAPSVYAMFRATRGSKPSYFADETISQDDEAILKPTTFIKGVASVSARIGPNYRGSHSISRIV
jgi:hypothetical protein